MPFLSSIQEEDKVPHVLGKFRNGSQVPLVQLHHAVLRGPSAFSVAQRELMAAFVSGINACDYCYGAHGAVAKQFGVPEATLSALIEDFNKADVVDELKPVFAFLKKLTLTPSKMTQSDVDAVLAAGWDEQALYDAIQVCCLYNYMNRFVEGLGLSAIAEQYEMEGKMLVEGGYLGIIDKLGLTE